jgi:hypothetical protein
MREFDPAVLGVVWNRTDTSLLPGENIQDDALVRRHVYEKK